jgi:hypothetical protein
LYVDAGGQHGFLATPGTTDAIADVILQVESLGLNAGIGDALTRTLRNAQASLATPHGVAAANQLTAFINQVRAFAARGLISATTAQSLIASANVLIQAIS